MHIRKTIISKLLTVLFLCGIISTATCYAGPNLIPNNDFEEDSSDPLKGWWYDWSWDGTDIYRDNKNYCSATKDGTKKHVMKISVPRKVGDKQGVKIMSPVVPFDSESKYKLSGYIRKNGINVRMHLQGYRWGPGVRPYEGTPHLGDLRLCYKGRLMEGIGKSWKKVSAVFPTPETAKSAQGQKIMKGMHFIGIYVYVFGGEGDVYIDNFSITKN